MAKKTKKAANPTKATDAGSKKKSLGEIAKAGDFDALNDRLEGQDDDAIIELYKWYTIAAVWHDEAEEIADGIQEAQISRYGDETLAQAHWEIGIHWLFGEEGLAVDAKQALVEIAYAKKCGLEVTAKEVESVRKRLAGAARTGFDKLFPPKGKPSAKKPAAKKTKKKASGKKKR
jgi:hypothetical protein